MKYTLTARELSNFFGQLGMLIHSGISLTEGLAILHDESQTDTDREIITALLTSMEETEVLHRQWKLPEDSPILLFLI